MSTLVFDTRAVLSSRWSSWVCLVRCWRARWIPLHSTVSRRCSGSSRV